LYPKSLKKAELALPRDHRDRAGQALPLDLAGQHATQTCETALGETEAAWVGDRTRGFRCPDCLVHVSAVLRCAISRKRELMAMVAR
jgi:hypothetical protein